MTEFSHYLLLSRHGHLKQSEFSPTLMEKALQTSNN